MTAQLRPLYNLQQLDSKIKVLEAQASQDDGSADVTRKLTQRERKLREVGDQQKALKTKLKDAELKLAAATDKVKEIEKKLYAGTTTNPKELAGFNQELEQLRQQKDRLETQALELMEQLEAIDTEFATVEKAVAKAKKMLADLAEKAQSSRQELEKQKADVQRRRDALVTEIDPTLVTRYELLRKRRDGVAVSHMRGNACGECGANLPDGVRQSVHERNLEICSHCERILFTE